MTLMAGNIRVYKAKLPVFQLLLCGFMAGLYIAMGAALCTICGTGFLKGGNYYDGI